MQSLNFEDEVGKSSNESKGDDPENTNLKLHWPKHKAETWIRAWNLQTWIWELKNETAGSSSCPLTESRTRAAQETENGQIHAEQH